MFDTRHLRNLGIPDEGIKLLSRLASAHMQCSQAPHWEHIIKDDKLFDQILTQREKLEMAYEGARVAVKKYFGLDASVAKDGKISLSCFDDGKFISGTLLEHAAEGKIGRVQLTPPNISAKSLNNPDIALKAGPVRMNLLDSGTPAEAKRRAEAVRKEFPPPKPKGSVSGVTARIAERGKSLASGIKSRIAALRDRIASPFRNPGSSTASTAAAATAPAATTGDTGAAAAAKEEAHTMTRSVKSYAERIKSSFSKQKSSIVMAKLTGTAIGGAVAIDGLRRAFYAPRTSEENQIAFESTGIQPVSSLSERLIGGTEAILGAALAGGSLLYGGKSR